MPQSYSHKADQIKIYELSHRYIIDNFHKLTESNKIKVSLAIVSKLIPQENILDGNITNTVKMDKVKIDDKEQELNLGSRVAEYTTSSN